MHIPNIFLQLSVSGITQLLHSVQQSDYEGIPLSRKGEYKGDLQFAINQLDMIKDGTKRMSL